jgi:putative ABC transport system ATP-binding protein
MNALELSQLRRRYQPVGGEQAFELFVPQLTLAAGEQIGLRGASGSGKTTLLHLIAGLLSPDSGRILVAGEDMAALSEAQRDRLRARKIGYVFQTFNLLPAFTAWENVRLALAFAGQPESGWPKELLERVGLSDRLQHRPSQMSVGQQQRVAVARALACRPALVLADEPTGNLDVRNAEIALQLIRDLCRQTGAALLLASHDPDILAQFERVEDLTSLNQAVPAPAETAEVR